MINQRSVKRFCVDSPEKIENYSKAIVDNEQTWDIHHIKENEGFSKQLLIKLGIYYKRPASELIFLTRKEHRKLHKSLGEDNPMFGKHHSDDAKKKISETRKEKIELGLIEVNVSGCHTEEANIKISKKAKDRLKDKTKHPMYGKTWKWYNDGIKNIMIKEGNQVSSNLKPGMIKKTKSFIKSPVDAS